MGKSTNSVGAKVRSSGGPMAQEKTLHIALGSENGLHTCVWNVKVDKSDVYISSQSTIGQVKASLHWYFA